MSSAVLPALARLRSPDQADYDALMGPVWERVRPTRMARATAMDETVATSWRREVPCFRCAGVAAALVVDYASGGRGITLTLTEFIVRKTSFLSVAATEGIAEEEGVELLRWLPPTFQGFFCRECDAAYCAGCWQVGPPQYDDEGYAGRAGVCPAGHESVVDA